MKIVDKRKFVTRVSLIILVIVFITLLTNKTFSRVEYKTKIIYVSKGDTLWSIAYDQQDNNVAYKNKNIRDIVSDIKNINNLDSSYIYDGQALKIPII